MEKKERNNKIRELAKTGMTMREIAKQFGITWVRVSHILWKANMTHSTVQIKCKKCLKLFTRKTRKRQICDVCKVKQVILFLKKCRYCGVSYETSRKTAARCKKCADQRRQRIANKVPTGRKTRQTANSGEALFEKIAREKGFEVEDVTKKRSFDFLVNNLMVEVKTSKETSTRNGHQFSLQRENTKEVVPDLYCFITLGLTEDEVFIIPTQVLTGKRQVTFGRERKHNRYLFISQYKDKWGYFRMSREEIKKSRIITIIG